MVATFGTGNVAPGCRRTEQGVGEFIDVPGGLFRIEVGNSLERHRAETLLTKEPETIAWIDRFDAGDVFYDIGANVGIYSLYAAATKSVEVVSIEPYYKNFYRLVGNIVENQFESIVPLAVGLGPTTGVQVLEVPDTRFGSSGSQLGQAVDDSGAAFEPAARVAVAAFALDDLVRFLQLRTPTHV